MSSTSIAISPGSYTGKTLITIKDDSLTEGKESIFFTIKPSSTAGQVIRTSTASTLTVATPYPKSRRPAAVLAHLVDLVRLCPSWADHESGLVAAPYIGTRHVLAVWRCHFRCYGLLRREQESGARFPRPQRRWNPGSRRARRNLDRHACQRAVRSTYSRSVRSQRRRHGRLKRRTDRRCRRGGRDHRAPAHKPLDLRPADALS